MATSAPRRLGFTLVELLVVIAIIGLLVALLLPAVQRVRENGRQLQCLNNIKQLSLAIVSYETSKGQLPGTMQLVKRSAKDYATIKYIDSLRKFSVVDADNSNDLNSVAGLSWATMLLPGIERGDVWDLIQQDDTEVPVPPIATFVCPSDSDVNSQPDLAGLSYSVNCGGWDRAANGAFLFSGGKGDIAANGVFFDLAEYARYGAKAPSVRIGSIKSTGTTLMMAENIHKTYTNPTDNSPLFSWLGGIAPRDAREQQFGIVWVVPTSGTAPSSGDTINDQERIGGNANDVVDFRPDKPRFARPASSHGSGANVAFCDGHSQYLRDDIDYIVYVQLMASNVTKCDDPASPRGPKTQSLTPTDPIRIYRTAPPLAEKDFN